MLLLCHRGPYFLFLKKHCTGLCGSCALQSRLPDVIMLLACTGLALTSMFLLIFDVDIINPVIQSHTLLNGIKVNTPMAP